mgnify:CR=1 FL=1
MGDDRTLSALQAAVKAMPTTPDRAAQVFRLVTSDDPTVADAWLGRVATGDNSLTTLRLLATHSARIGQDLRAIHLGPHDLRASFGTDYISLTIHDADTAKLAYISALIDAGRYQEAHDLLSKVGPSAAASYIRAVLYSRTQRWPDLLTAVAGCAGWINVDLGRAGSVLEAQAAAHLKLLDRASTAAARAAQVDDDITRDALFCQALVMRHNDDQSAAQTLLTDIGVRWPRFQDAQAALADPTYGLTFTDAATIDTRTDAWDPGSATTAAQRAAASAKTLLASAEDDMAKMIGLSEVKAQLARLRRDSIARFIRQRKGIPTSAVSRHILMVGPPGVGKTVTARTIAAMFCGLGILPRADLYETKRSKLVGRHLGDAENNTRELLESALGATVFIDEFGGLIQTGLHGGDAYGQGVIDTLVPWMENERERSVIIAAGYPRACQRVLAADQGLLSRFKTTIEFHSYNPDELIQLAEHFATAGGDTLEPGSADRVLREPFSRFYNSLSTNDEGDEVRAIDTLGNGRFVRKIIESAEAVRNERVIDHYGLGTADLTDEALVDSIDNAAMTGLTADDLHAGLLDSMPGGLR